jgi:hypothetical protein
MMEFKLPESVIEQIEQDCVSLMSDIAQGCEKNARKGENLWDYGGQRRVWMLGEDNAFTTFQVGRKLTRIRFAMDVLLEAGVVLTDTDEGHPYFTLANEKWTEQLLKTVVEA